MLVTTRKGSKICIYNAKTLGGYELEDSIEVPFTFDEYYLDKDNTLFLLADKSLFILKDDYTKINTKSIQKLGQINTNNGIIFFYKSGLILFSKCILENKEEDEKIVHQFEEDFDFFVSEKEEIYAWQGTKIFLFLEGRIHEAKVSFLIKEVKPTTPDKLILLDHSMNIYLFDSLDLKIVSGIKSINKNPLSYDCSLTSPLFSLSNSTTLFVLDVLARQKIKELPIKEIKFLRFKSETSLLIQTDKTYEVDLLTDSINEVISSEVDTFTICHENNGYKFNFKKEELSSSRSEVNLKELSENISVSNEFVEDKAEVLNLNLKAEIFKILFQMKEEIEDLKERIGNLERKNELKES